jgi:TolB protein
MENKTFNHICRAGIFLILLCLQLALPCRSAEAKVYIDITSPQKQLPIAIQELTGPYGKEISEIIKKDLDFTGLFFLLDEKAFIEKPEQAFSRENWSVLGAEVVLKGSVRVDKKVIASIYLYDVFEGRAVLKKRYKAEKTMIVPLAHSIANDIYKEITGHKGVFRTKIAFVVESKGVHELYLMDWDGGRMKNLGIRARTLLTPHWSEDGTKLLYSAERQKRWGIYLLDFLKKREMLIFSSKGTNIAGDFFPGGNEFALSSSKAGTADIYVYNIPKSRLTRLTSERGIEVSPAVSPDGLTIAFVSDRGGSPQIYTMDKIGYNKARITFNGSYNTSPTWSPKGDVIAFSGRYKGRNQIFIVKPDGSGLTMLTEEGNNEDPSFSPDGRFIVFTSDRDGEKGIYIMRANGEAQTRITPRGIKAFGPRWSPK